ncbi:hypothetical protein V8F20_003571 [Naviculisporaceae sp. PSN 640]
MLSQILGGCTQCFFFLTEQALGILAQPIQLQSTVGFEQHHPFHPSTMMTPSLSIRRYAMGRAIHPHCSILGCDDQLWCLPSGCNLASVVWARHVPF